MIDCIYILYGCQPLTLLSLQHIRAYTPEPVRFLLVDNAVNQPALRSLDGLRACLQPQDQLIEPEDNIGVYRAANLALCESTRAGVERVMVASSDCFVLPGWYEVCRTILEATDAVWVSPGEQPGPYTLDAVWHHAMQPPAWVAQLGRCGSHHALLNWRRLQDTIAADGELFDPQFFFTYGDTDLYERLRRASLIYAAADPAYAIHLGQVSRSTTITADTNRALEVADEERFHRKWAAHPDVLARHRRLFTVGTE